MTNIQDTIERKHYAATEHDVELLAASHFQADTLAKRADGQYLRILVAALKAQFNGSRRKLSQADTDNHMEFLAATHAKLYSAVVRGVTTDDVADNEGLDVDVRRQRAAVRNGRAAFARSAASTLKAFLRAGGDVRTLTVDTVTKGTLRASTSRMVAPDANPAQVATQAALGRVLRLVQAMAAEDPEGAREALEEAMERMRTLLNDLDQAPGAGQGMTLPQARAPVPRATSFRPSETTVRRARAQVM